MVQRKVFLTHGIGQKGFDMVYKAASPKRKEGKKFKIKLVLEAEVDASVFDSVEIGIPEDEKTVASYLEGIGYGSIYTGTWEANIWNDPDRDFTWDITISEVGKAVTR